MINGTDVAGPSTGRLIGRADSIGRSIDPHALKAAEAQKFADAKQLREPTVADQIMGQCQQLHAALQELESRAESIVSRLGYPVGAEASGEEKRPSRGGALGSIADALDLTGPRFARLFSYLDTIARQV